MVYKLLVVVSLLTSPQQALHEVIQLIAMLWPASERPRYERAARRFRLPYWDWAVSPPPGESVLPRSIGGSPFVDVDGPKGLQRIANPLFSYQFKLLDRTAFNSNPVSLGALASLSRSDKR